jgi:hypothetical protein
MIQTKDICYRYKDENGPPENETTSIHNHPKLPIFVLVDVHDEKRDNRVQLTLRPVVCPLG